MDFRLILASGPEGPGPGALQTGIYEGLRTAILEGRLALGERVPSTRELGSMLGISRTTATAAYQRLHGEGYLETAAGSGTFVSRQLPERMLEPERPTAAAARAEGPEIALSERGRSLARAAGLEAAEGSAVIRFRNGRPALEEFPLELWRRLAARRLRAVSADMMDYQADRKGYGPLREAVARYLTRFRAVRCDAEQVILVSGSQQALAIAGEILIDAGDPVAVENPGYRGAVLSFATRGARLHPVAVDGEGAIPESLPRRAKLAYFTPSHQFPLGGVLALARRLEIIAWAETAGSVLIEDDYDSEFRYEGRPIPAMQGLDRSGRVLYIGTFSKVLFPGLRLGYIVAPARLAGVIERAKFLADRQCAMLEQLVLTDFLEEGHFERHIRRMRTLYAGRRAALAEAVAKHMGPRVRLVGDAAGMHALLEVESSYGETELIARAAAAGVGVGGAAACYLAPRLGPPQLILGFAGLGERSIREGIRRLSRVL
ncbi:MAG: PLP-dependent aminotransferase family protein [Bryobacteraceae bacterium]